MTEYVKTIRRKIGHGMPLLVGAGVYVSNNCTDFSGEASAQTSEVLGLRWFDADALPPDISPPSLRPLRAFAERVRSGRGRKEGRP